MARRRGAPDPGMLKIAVYLIGIAAIAALIALFIVGVPAE